MTVAAEKKGFWRYPWRTWALTLLLGMFGGLIFQLLNLPLPWMLGAIAATTPAAIAGVNLRIPEPFRMVMVSVLGVMLGSAFHPGLVGDMRAWWPSLLGLVLYVPLATVSVRGYFQRAAGYGPVTATFAAAPGGLTQMILIGTALGGDERTIALTHGIRILLVVTILPTAFTLLTGYERPQASGGFLGFDFGSLPSLSSLLWMVGCAAVGMVVGKILRLPAAFMMGPMLVSGLVHGFGLTVSHPPPMLVAASQLVIGSGIGARFAGVSPRAVARTFVTAIGSTVVMLGITMAFAATLSELTSLPFRDLVLAYSPGGVVEMSLISLSLGVDVAFVSSHHVARILLVVVLAPLVVKAIRRRSKTSDDPVDR